MVQGGIFLTLVSYPALGQTTLPSLSSPPQRPNIPKDLRIKNVKCELALIYLKGHTKRFFVVFFHRWGSSYAIHLAYLNSFRIWFRLNISYRFIARSHCLITPRIVSSSELLFNGRFHIRECEPNLKIMFKTFSTPFVGVCVLNTSSYSKLARHEKVK